MQDVGTGEGEQLGGRLHVVATPIGNLGDLSPRAAAILSSVDLVLAEDTRRTGGLLAHLGLGQDGTPRTPMWSVHEHNESEKVAGIIERLRAGDAVALVSDAGTPAVSDPGHRVVRACVEAGIPVVPVPGASAVLVALVGSGLASDRFTFEGFLPRKGKSRQQRLAELTDESRTMVIFVSPHRADKDLLDLAQTLGEQRPAVLARELTKMHEEFVRGTLGSLAEAAQEGFRGELVLVVEGRSVDPDDAPDAETLAAMVASQVAQGVRSKQAIADVAVQTGQPKKVVYQAVLDAAP